MNSSKKKAIKLIHAREYNPLIIFYGTIKALSVLQVAIKSWDSAIQDKCHDRPECLKHQSKEFTTVNQEQTGF